MRANTFYITILLNLLFLNFSIFGTQLPAPNGIVDLELTSSVKNNRIELGDIGEATISIKNNNTTEQATNIKVIIFTPYSSPISIFQSTNPEIGVFNISSNLWEIEKLEAGSSASLSIKYKIISGGSWYLEAEVFAVDQIDPDSSPFNLVEFEDDYTRSCVSTPINVENSDFPGMQYFVDDSKNKNLQWLKNGKIYQSEGSNSLQFSGIGEYTFVNPLFNCPSGGCCPLIVQTGTTNSCCKPLEYFMERTEMVANSVEDTSTLTMAYQNGPETGKDARVWSAVPENNLGTTETIQAAQWSWTQGEGTLRTFIDFDLSKIPTNAIIESASLELFYTGDEISYNSEQNQKNSTVSNESYLRRVINPWEEDSVTWLNQPSYTIENEIIISDQVQEPKDIVLDMKKLIQDYVRNPESSHGFVFMLKNEQKYRYLFFGSSDHADASKRPKFRVNYSLRKE
ncbi:DNRLRE domain-containing protein [Arcticibacterium luteifluviistationis]|uniref:Uncharacterized protein n=1 Tax=Arcticibacterium luteifluviistationis TaxID=1784714 RepID=A0A2Z4GBV2_9BACT|nr:DNRLRE domain-containing protein [Arcticibacterium luteifluviistationis]AWV98769.1 hypothetical protein DJ013_11525 [Arcticibacterium luteifluviistationis]